MKLQTTIIYWCKYVMLSLVLTMGVCSCYSESSPSPVVFTSPPSPTQKPHWKIYETELLKATLDTQNGLCEWVILGAIDQEVYVYTLCQGIGPIESAVSVPVVIYLTESGEIRDVKLPRDGVNYPKDIRTMFPEDVQAIIFARDAYDNTIVEHLEQRKVNGGPPLIVELGTPLP